MERTKIWLVMARRTYSLNEAFVAAFSNEDEAGAFTKEKNDSLKDPYMNLYSDYKVMEVELSTFSDEKAIRKYRKEEIKRVDDEISKTVESMSKDTKTMLALKERLARLKDSVR